MGNTHRQCAVQINNDTENYILVNPSVYIYSGYCKEDLTPTVGPSKGSALFVKTPDTACGAVGVFTYDLSKKSTQTVEKKMAVMFSNPYDFNLYSNFFAVGIFDKNQPCDYSLYDKMCNGTQTEFVRGKAGSDLTYDADDVTISATMTDAYQPDLTVKISNREA